MRPPRPAPLRRASGGAAGGRSCSHVPLLGACGAGSARSGRPDVGVLRTPAFACAVAGRGARSAAVDAGEAADRRRPRSRSARWRRDLRSRLRDRRRPLTEPWRGAGWPGGTGSGDGRAAGAGRLRRPPGGSSTGAASTGARARRSRPPNHVGRRLPRPLCATSAGGAVSLAEVCRCRSFGRRGIFRRLRGARLGRARRRLDGPLAAQLVRCPARAAASVRATRSSAR